MLWYYSLYGVDSSATLAVAAHVCRSEKLKPFWLSLSDKDQLPVLDFLSQALLNPEPSKEYREAVQRALNIPHSKVVPFFGTFLRELRAILQGMPSLIVLPSEGARSIEVRVGDVPCYTDINRIIRIPVSCSTPHT